MPVTVKVNGTDNTVVHKGSTGMAKCTVPDVCKTPSPGGPVPIPYPVIISMSSDLADGTTTVTADGGNMCAIKGSNFSRCSGDEAGTAGGVKSGTNMKEATWILYSFDVKMDGQNACRKSDKMMMNHENTVCLAGEDQTTKRVKALKELVCKCSKQVDNDTKAGRAAGDPNCSKLGTLKHDCCDAALKNGDVPGVGGEQGYNPNGTKSTMSRLEAAFSPKGRGLLFPDAAILNSGGQPMQFVDFKFQCPKPPRAGEPRPQGWTPGRNGKLGQFEKYKKLGRAGRMNPKVRRNPRLITNESCK
jgi:hypothetical protein